MKRIVVPAATTLVVVASLVALAGWNRSSAPLQVMTLTERELALPRIRPTDDDPGLQLRIAFNIRNDLVEARNWLTDDRLRALGFPLHVPFGSPEAPTYYRQMLPRTGWVVLEYDGPSWREVERQRALTKDYKPGEQFTRLVPVDAGPDVEPLVSRYQTGHLILRATFGIWHYEQRGPIVQGQLQQLVPDTVSVPRHMRQRVADLNAQDVTLPPRYEVDLAVGRLGVPYIRDVRRLR